MPLLFIDIVAFKLQYVNAPVTQIVNSQLTFGALSPPSGVGSEYLSGREGSRRKQLTNWYF